MQQQTVEIRLELLKKIGEGYSQREVVKHLTEKFGITDSGAYYHFETRDKWLSQYCKFDKEFAFQVRQRFNYIYREASFRYQHANDDNARIGFMRVMLEANGKCAEYIPQAVNEAENEDAVNVPIHAYTDAEKKVLDKASHIIHQKEIEYFNKPQGSGLH